MRNFDNLQYSNAPIRERVTSWWHGNIAASTWSSHNVASVTENGVADVTVTFQVPYTATPCAIVGGGTALNIQGTFIAATSTSVRAGTFNTSNAATVGRKSSIVCVGDQ